MTRFESRFERFDPEPGPPAAGGGTLLDFGSHLVDQALVLLGPVESVYAEWRVRESGLDDDVFVALTHAGGARSHLWGSWSQGAPGSRFRVTGTEAAYEVGGPMDGQEDALLAGRTPATEGERWGDRAARALGRAAPGRRGRAGADRARAVGHASTRRSPRPSAGRAASRSTRATPSPPRRCSTPPAAARRTASWSGLT